MRNVECVFVLLIGCYFGYSSTGLKFDPNLRECDNILPWIGILRVKAGITDAATGLIMVHKQLAIGSAIEIGSVKVNILRKFGKAMFCRNTWWSCGIEDYIIHPEFFLGPKNTLAIVYLICNIDDLYWNWPEMKGVDRYSRRPEEESSDNFYSIRLTDSHQSLQQVIEKVEEVDSSSCESFYKKEQLNYPSMQPAHPFCFKVSKSQEQCVIDAGMALANKSRNTWTLVGISTLGPGCSLPARYISITQFLPWIKFYLKQEMNEPYEDQDTVLLSKLNDSTIVMRPSLAYVKEVVRGKCNTIDGHLFYREFGTIRAPTHTATAVYSLSLYDLLFPTTTCIMVTVICNRRSKTRYWVDNGFHQEDIEDFVKTIPIPKRNNTKLPKILFLKDTYKKYRDTSVINLEFKFEFTDEAKMDLEFYGRNISSPMRPPSFPYLPPHKQITGKLPFGANFNAREDETDGDEEDKNDSFFHF